MKTFVEIGCADFDTLLPLAARGWKGYMVEPIRKHCESLRRQAERVNVRMEDLEICELAISDHSGTLEMIESVNGEGWAKGISHVVGESSGLLDHPLNSQYRGNLVSVRCQTLDEFLAYRGIKSVDFLKVDVEGHELAIFRNYSWRLKPTLIKVEHKHLDDQALKRLLASNGYHVYVEREDIYAIY